MNTTKTNEPDISTEEKILQAAEEEFIYKGYGTAKMPEIAKRAGVNHALLHYYFRNKENLFESVFKRKLALLLKGIWGSFNPSLSFTENIQLAAERHYDFIFKNSSIPLFIINELIRNPERLQNIAAKFKGEALPFMHRIQDALDEEIAKGNIRQISLFDLILTMLSLNIFPFIASPIMRVFFNDEKTFQKELQHRREENVTCILNSLKPEKL